MINSLIAACVQNCASVDANKTMGRVEELIRDAAAKGADLICTPEFFSCLDTQLSGLSTNPHTEEAHPALPRFRSLADEGVNILAISTSEIKISVIINENETKKAIKKLHTVFNLD